MKRRCCVVCQSTNLENFFELSNFPAYMGVTQQPSPLDLSFDQIWSECGNCGGIQLESPISLDILYADNHHTSPIGKTWLNHHERFADFIIQNLGASQSILEIGAGDGYLAKLLLNHYSDLRITVVEPSPKIPHEGIKVVTGLIENHLDLVAENQIVIHSHVLEHIYEPMKFLIEISERMSTNQLMICSIPNIEKLLKSFGTNSLNFEHTYFLDKEVMRYWASLANFEIISSQDFGEHSSFYVMKKSNLASIGAQYWLRRSIRPAELFVKMWTTIREFAESCNERLAGNSNSNFLFGAHVFSQGILSQGLNQNLVSHILDNDQAKQGKRLYGTELLVKSPNKLTSISSPTVILLASHYQNEIKEQILKLNPTTRFLELN